MGCNRTVPPPCLMGPPHAVIIFYYTVISNIPHHDKTKNAKLNHKIKCCQPQHTSINFLLLSKVKNINNLCFLECG